jgi:hypothetical protein
MRLADPRLVIPVGSLGLSLFLPGTLDDWVGRAVHPDGRDAPNPPDDEIARVLVPLPHPSGQSRWLNDGARAARLEEALERLRGLLPWAERAARRML